MIDNSINWIIRLIERVRQDAEEVEHLKTLPSYIVDIRRGGWDQALDLLEERLLEGPKAGEEYINKRSKIK